MQINFQSTARFTGKLILIHFSNFFRGIFSKLNKLFSSFDSFFQYQIVEQKKEKLDAIGKLNRKK